MLIIDCYNLLHATMPPSLAGLDEGRLCRLLAGAGYGGGRANLVCDGVVKPHTPAESGIDGIELVYSGHGRSADDLIIDMLRKNSAPRRLTVVTNDRQIQKAARRRRAKVRSCESLIHELASHVATPRSGTTSASTTKPDTVKLTDQQVQQWLGEFGIDTDSPPDEMVDESL